MKLSKMVSISGLRETHISQLLYYIKLAQETGFYWGNPKQFLKRHNEIKDWVENILKEEEGK